MVSRIEYLSPDGFRESCSLNLARDSCDKVLLDEYCGRRMVGRCYKDIDATPSPGDVGSLSSSNPGPIPHLRYMSKEQLPI